MSKLKLEESDTVINVTLSVSIDRNGRLLLADMGECKVRVYDHEARLLMQFGRKGDGPGEFAAPITPIRLESGDVVVPDMGRGLLTFDSMGTLLDQTRPPLRVLFGVAQVDDTTLLVAGPGTPGTPAADYLLHRWSIEHNRIEGSFFRIPRDPATVQLGPAIGWVGFDIRHDTVAAAYAMVDTLYFFSLDGLPTDSVPVPFTNYRRPKTASLEDRSVQAFRRWAAAIDRIGTVDWQADGTLIVQADRRVGAEHEYTLVHMDRTGAFLHESIGTPRLLATDGASLYFLDPASPTPDRWVVSRYR